MSQSRLKRSERFEQRLDDRAGALRRLLIVDHTKFEARSLEVICPHDLSTSW